MIQARFRRMLSALAVVLLVIVAGGCGGDDNPNQPPGGGGSLELNSADLAGGGAGVYVHTMPMTAATFPYHCKKHSGMTGSVTVAAGGAANAAVNITDNNFTPNTVTVAPGAVVTWTNNGGAVHTVTSN